MISLIDESKNGRLQFCDGAEHAAFEPPSRELGEEAFHRIEPGRRYRGEVEVQRGWQRYMRARSDACGCVIIDDGVDRFSFLHLGVNAASIFPICAKVKFPATDLGRIPMPP